MISDWPEFKLKDLISIKHGYAYKGEFFSKEKTPEILVTPGNFAVGGGFKSDKFKYYNGPIEDSYVLSPGDLIVTMTDLSKEGDTLGFSALVPDSKGVRYHHNQRVGLVDIKRSDLILKDYLYFLLRTNEYRNEVLASLTGTSVKHTSPTKILNYSFKLPPIEYQENIARKLISLENKIINNTVMNASLENISQRIFESWFVDFDPVKASTEGVKFDGLSPEIQALFPNEFEQSELGMIPKGWDVIKFKELIGKYIDNRGKTPPLVEKGIPLIEVKHLDPNGCYPILKTQKQVSKETYDTWFRAHVEKNDILMSTVGTIGRTSLVNDTNLTIAQNVIGVRFNDQLTPLYMFRTIKGSYFQGQIESRLVITVQASIKRKDMDTIPILVPPKGLLKKFEEIMIPLQDSQFLRNQQNITLTKIRDKLLPRLISGKITIQKAEELLEEAS